MHIFTTHFAVVMLFADELKSKTSYAKVIGSFMYMFNSKRVTWHEAFEACKQHGEGYYLADIIRDIEVNAMHEMLTNHTEITPGG